MIQQYKARDSVIFVFALLALVALVVDFGFPDDYWDHLLTDIFYLLYGFIILSSSDFESSIRKLSTRGFGHLRSWLVVISVILLVIFAAINTANYLLSENRSLNLATAFLVLVNVLREFSSRIYALDRQTLHPALVFALSFVVLISVGTVVLMLPNSSTEGVRLIDSLFTSTSAVCVTGLVVLDTGTDFTLYGQSAILGLIQSGALGMLSFTSLFVLLFKGEGSYENRLNLKDMINAPAMSSASGTLIKILFFVFLTEAIGFLLIYFSLDESFDGRLFYSIFHSISAFCNAGFSTESNSLYSLSTRTNFQLHLSIAFLIILGGIGYLVVIDMYSFIKKYAQFVRQRLFPNDRRKPAYKPGLRLNTKMVLFTTAVLLVFGTLSFLVLEWNGVLSEHTIYGKVITAFFNSVTARTAGFNTIPMEELTTLSVLIFLFLMWIGASPGSTGGGVKTTTFAVVGLNIYQQALGLSKIHIAWKKIDPKALNRATAIIALSLIVIGISTFCLVLFDEQLGFLPLLFESISAFATVGLSTGITGQLSDPSKVVIIVTMFVGRVGFLTLLTGMLQHIYKFKYSPIDYPEEKILIN